MLRSVRSISFVDKVTHLFHRIAPQWFNVQLKLLGFRSAKLHKIIIYLCWSCDLPNWYRRWCCGYEEQYQKRNRSNAHTTHKNSKTQEQPRISKSKTKSNQKTKKETTIFIEFFFFFFAVPRAQLEMWNKFISSVRDSFRAFLFCFSFGFCFLLV